MNNLQVNVRPSAGQDGGDGSTQQQVQQNPVAKTIELFDAQPYAISDDGIPMYDYFQLRQTYDDNHIAWVRQVAKNNGSDVTFTMPDSEQFINSHLMNAGINPEAQKETLLKPDGTPWTSPSGNTVQVKNVSIDAERKKAEDDYSIMQKEFENFAFKVDELSKNPEHFNQLNDIYTKKFYGYDLKKTELAAKGTGDVMTVVSPTIDGTIEEQAEANGYIFNSLTGEYEEYGFWDKVRDRSLNTLNEVLVDIPMNLGMMSNVGPIGYVKNEMSDALRVLPGYREFEIITKGLPGLFSNVLPEKTVLTTDYNPYTDNYELTKKSAYDRTISSSEIYGVFGRDTKDNAFQSFFGNLYNFINPVTMAASISGTGAQWAMDIEDFLYNSEQNKNFYSEDYDRAIGSQNFAISASYTPSQRASEQPWSLEAISGYLGTAVGIYATIMATKGLNSLTAGSKIAMIRYAPSTALLSAQETASFNKELNDIGAPRELAVFMLPAYYGMTSAIESFGSNILLKDTKLGSKVLAKEIIDNSVGINKGSTFKRFMFNVWKGRPENWIQGYATQMVEEGIEEGMQQVGSNLFKMGMDYSIMNEHFRNKTDYKMLYEMGYISAGEQATFFDPSSYDSFSSIMGNVGEGVLHAAVVGAISSVPMSMMRSVEGFVKKDSPSLYYKNDSQKTIFMGVLNGQGQQLRDIATASEYRGRLGSVMFDDNGNPKPQNDNGEWVSQNKSRYNMLMNEILLAEQLKENIPQSTIESLNGDFTLMSDYMALTNSINKTNEEIKALIAEQEASGVNNEAKIKKLNEELVTLNNDLSEYNNPEYDGGKFSKKFNDKFLELRSKYVFARNLTNELYAKATNKSVLDITEKDIASSLYGKMFIDAKNSIDFTGVIASRQRTANAETVMNNHNNSMRLMYGKKGETAQKNIESLLSEIEGIKSKAFESPSERLSAIVNTLSRSEGMMSDMASISQLNPYLEEDKRVDMDQMMKKAKSAISSLGEGLGDFQYGETEDIFDMLMSANPISPNAPQVEYPMRAAELESDKDVLNAKAIESYIGYFNDLNIEEAKESLSKLTPENEARYFDSMEYMVSTLETISKNGVKNSLMDPDNVLKDISSIQQLLELSSKVAKHDRFANDAFFSQEGTKELQHKDDYRLDKEQYESVMNNLIAYNKRMSDVLEKVYSEKGVGDHNIISALHARVQVNFYRDMFTKGMTIGEDVVNKVGTITEYLENSLGTDKYNTFKNLLLAVIKQEKTADGKMRGRFDYSKKDIVNPAYEENGVTKGILSEEGMRTTEELQAKIFNLESFIKENGNVFFSKEAIDLTVSNLNNAMHALGGETFINLNNPLKILRDNVMENYGYFNSNFDNAALGITAVDLLKASAIIDSSTGEGSLIKSPGEIHGAEVKTGKLYEDIKYIDSETVNSFNYKWAINYLSMLAGSSTHEMYSEQLDRFNSVKANDGQVYTTFEQMLALGQIGAFFNGGNRVFRDVIDAEAKFFKTKYDSIKQELKKRNRDKELDEGGSIERSLFEANMRFVENAITLTGDLAAGKTEILRYALDKIVAKKVANKEVVSISILANNNDLYSKNFKFVNDYLKNKYPEIKLEINNQFMDTRNILTQEGLGDLVIIDEAGLMKDTFFSDPNKGDNDIKKLFKVGGRQLLMIADEYQVTELARDNGTSALKAGMVTIPLTERFRSGIAITNTVADFFRNMIAQKKASINDLSVSDLQMPAVNHKINEDGTKIGVKYNTSVRDVVNEFLNDNTEVSKALIIPNVDYLQYSDYEPLRAKDSQGRYITDNDGKYLIDDKYKNEVRIIIDDLSAKAQQVPSIQGMDAEHVYVAIDYMWIIQNEKEWSWRIAPKAMYTSVGRVADKGRGANYVSLIGNTAALAGDEVLTKLSPNKGRNIENEKKYLQNLVNKTTRQTIQQQDNSNSPETSLPRIVDDIFVNDGYFYTGKSKNLQKSYFAGKPKGALYTSRLTVEDGAITEHIDEFKIDVLKNKKIGKSYIARFFKDGNGKITEARLYAYNEDGEKSNYEFKANLSGNLTEMFDTLSNGNKNNKRLFEVIGVHGSEISNGQFNVPSMMLPLSHWKNVVEGNADYAVVEYLKNNKDIIVDVFYEESQTGEAVLTYENKKFYVSHYDMFKAEIREEVSYDDAVALVNGTLTRSRIEGFHTNIVRKTLANQQAEPSASTNSVPGTENSFEDTSIIRTNTIEVTLDSAIDDNGNIKVVTGLQTSTNKNSNDALIELTDANGISETVSVNKFEEILQTQVSRNKDAYQGNEEKAESKITSGKRTGLVKDGKANSPIYFYGRSVYAGPRMSEVPDADKEAVSYLIQNVKQAVLRRGSQFGFTNKRVVLVKDFSYLSDNNAIVSNDIAVALKGDLNVNIQTILAVKNDDSEYIKNLKQNYLELYNKYSDAVNESLSIISVSEDLFLNEISNGKDNMLSLIKEKYPDGNDASYNVLSNVIINNFDTIESFMNGTNTELLLGNVSNVMMNNEHGLSGIDSPSNKVMEPGDKFISEQEKRGFKLEKVIAFHQIGGKEFKAKLSYVFKSFYGTTSNVIAMPRRIANVEGYTESIITDLKTVKAKKGTAKMLAFNNSIISSVLMQNLSIVKEDPLFTKYFEFADNNGKPRISLNKAASRVKSKSINEQENSVIDAFIEELQKKDVVAKFNDLRVGIKFTKNSDGSISPDSRLVDFNVKGINATGMYIDFNSLSFSNNVVINKEDIETNEKEVTNEIAFTTIIDGMDVNKNYGNKETTFKEGFDVRTYPGVVATMTKGEPFMTTIEHNGKKYDIIGVKVPNKNGIPSDRTGYAFASVESDKNISIEILIKEAYKSAKALGYNDNDILLPNIIENKQNLSKELLDAKNTVEYLEFIGSTENDSEYIAAKKKIEEIEKNNINNYNTPQASTNNISKNEMRAKLFGGKAMTKTDNDANMSMHMNEGMEYINRVLGNPKDIVDVVGEGTIFTEAGAAYGLYELGKIKIEANQDSYTHPLVWKHETGHFVFNNISNEKRERLLTAGAIEMVRMGYYTEEQVRTLTDDKIEHWIVKTYQEYGNVDYLYGYMNNETFAGKILNKFKNFVNKLFGVVFADNYLSSFFDAIERGDFRNMEITDTNTVAKAMDKETSEYEVDNEDLNKEPSKKTSKRDAFMEAIGYNDKVKRDVVERSRSYIANESLVNPKNTSVTLMESARNFINTFDQFDFSEDEVNVNGSKVKVPDITPDMVSSLNDGDYDTYAMYIISQHGDYILGELFDNKNLVSAWRHYNETSESRDISMTMSGMFDMVLSAIPYQKLMGNYYTPIQFKYLDPSRVKMLIKNNASDIVALANKSGKNILDVMIEDFYKKASGNLRSADYRQNLYSIAKFLEGHKERIKYMEQQTTEFNLDAYMASLDIFNKIGSTVVSTWNKNGKEYVYENGELKVLKLTSSNLSRMRTQIVDEVSKASLNGDIISDRLFNYLKGSIAKTRYNNRSIGKIYSIDENGLSVNVEGTNIKLIEKVKVKSGVAFRFTVDGRETYINQSRKLFTVLGLDRSRNGNNINSYITKNNSEFDVIQDYVKSYTNEQKDNQLVAEAIYYMMASANQWAEYKKQLNDLDTIKEDIDDYDAKKASLIESLNSGTLDGFNTLKDDIANFMKKMRSKQVDDSKKKNKTIDTSIGVETAGEEQVLNFYNPTDFENFMKLMADLEISGDTKGALPVLYDSKGNRIPAYGISNFMLDASQRGMFMTDQKTPGKIYKEVNGKVISMHPLSNEVDGFVITDFQKSFMFSDKSSTKTPNSSDLARVSIDEWYNSLIESAGKKVNFSVFDITNRQDHYSYNLNMDKPMIVVNEKEDGKSVFYDKKVIVSKYEKGFEYYANGAQYSANKLNNLLTKYGHGKTIDGYFGKNFNGPKSKYQTMTNELNMALKSYAKEGSKLRLEIMSNLIEGADYIIDKDGNMTIGRSISFDTHSFWNYINYDIINKAKDVDSKFEAITKASQTGYQNLASTLSKHGYKLDDKYSKIIGYDAEGKYVYYKSDKDGKVTNNPLMFGFYLQDQVHRTFFDSLTVSDFTIFPTDVKKSKRKGIVTSNSLVAFYYPGLAKITKLNFLVTASTRGTITVNGKTTNPLNNDGFSRGSLFGKVINELGFGGQFSGEEGAAKKTTLVDQDIVNGGIKMIKHAIEFNTNESYYNSDIVRKLERTFMLSWSDKVEVEFNRIGSNNTFYPYKMFLESLNEGLTPEDATKKIFKSIIMEYSPEEQDAILNNFYKGQADESTIKAEMIGKTPYTVEQIDDIDKAYRELDENGKLTMLPSMTLNAESLRFVTNLNQDVSDMEDNVAAQHQFISIATELNTVNEDGSIKRNYSAEIDTILSDLFKRRAKKYQEKISKTSDVNRFVSDSRKAKILNFTRIVAQQSVDNIKGMSNLGTIMNDPKVDVRIPLVSEDMKRMYRGNMDRFVNKTKMNGARCTVLPSNHIALYTINDGKTHWSMRDIETTYGIVFSDKMLDQDIIKVGELEFKKTRAKPMMWDEGKKVQLTEGIIPNPLLQEMNMLPEESLRSIFLIKTRNGRNIDVKDTQDMEIGQVVTLITNSILSMSIGNTTIDGFNPDANEYNTHVFYRNNKAIVDKIMKDGKETGQVDPKDLKTLKIAIKDFYRKWEMVLSEYNQTRIPTGHLGQVDIGRIVMFTGTGNNSYIPGELGVRNDGDFDGDQNQFYTKVATEYVKEYEKENREDTIQDLQNKVLDLITEAYLDPDNVDKIDRSSNVDGIRQLIDIYNKAYDNPISSFGAMLDNAQRAKAGSKGVSIFANLISAYTEILRSPLNPFTNKELEGDISITRNNGNWTQIALDSASNIGIGELGITEQSLPLFAISLVAFDKNIKTADDLNKTIINFFHNAKVKEILRFAEKSSNLDSYYSADTLLRNIYGQNNKIKEEAKGITKEDYNKAVKAYKDAQPELKKVNKEIASILKEENLNDLWKEINNKELFERLSAKSEYLSSLMDNYKDVPQSQEEKDVNAETLSNFAQVMIDIYSDFDSFDAKAIKRLSENSGSDIGVVAGKLLQLLETKNDLYEKINGKKTKSVDADGKETISVKKGYLQTMALYNNKAIVNDMYKKAVLAEQTRRFSVINSLRNDVKNKSDERYAQILEIELALGMTIEDFLSGKKSTLSNHLNFFKTHNNKYLKATSTEDMKMILDIETDIYYAYSKTKKEGTSLSDVIRTSGFSKHIGILQNLKNEYMGYESPHIDDHRLFKETFDRYTSELFAMPTKAQKVAFDKTIKSYILNRYLELKNATVSLDIYDDTDLINGTLAFSRMEAPSLKNLKLWKVNDAQSFISNLPVTFSFYQRMAKSGDNTLFDNTGGDNSKLLEIVKAFRENEFLLKYTVKGSPNAMYMSIDSDMTLSDDQKKALADEFSKLPQELKDLIFYYESLRNAYTFKAGSAYDMMPNEVYYDQSQYMDKIISELDDIVANEKSSKIFKKRFVENLMKNTDALSYLPSKDYEEFGVVKQGKLSKLKSSEIVKQKVSPGDGSNTRGYSSLYRDTNINGNDIVVNSDGQQVFATSIDVLYDNDINHDVFTKGIILRSLNTDMVRALSDAYMDPNKSLSITKTYAEKKNFKSNESYFTNNGVPLKVTGKDTTWTFSVVGNNIKSSNILPNQVNYMLKSVDILMSDKAKQVFDKGSKNNWNLEKILNELQIPKEQKNLLLELGITNREQLAIELASKYSYTVEINIGKVSSKFMKGSTMDEIFINGNNYMWNGNRWLNETTMKDANKSEIDIIEETIKNSEKENSFYYSNLTVPGGTNYTENEISTPLITPSIKGHAQFSTDNGIGWFRSDEQVINGQVEDNRDPQIELDENGNYVQIQYGKLSQTGGTPTKTRRILEIQSDLFQKGRDKDKLTKNGIGQPLYSAENEFLQLLNKDNNWVTFFIKSIIQDSAKKGYEKVLFPKGETAAKIEGHETIANEIEYLNKEIETFKNAILNKTVLQEVPYVAKIQKRDDGRFEVISGYADDYLESYGIYNTFKEADNVADKLEKQYNKGGVFNEKYKNEYKSNIKNLEARKQQYKSEGIEKLRPIEAFYEIKIGNILEKVYGKDNIKTITDEYGNEWREIDIDVTRDMLPILFSNFIESPILEQIMERAKVNQNDAAQILIDKFAKLMPGTNVFIETEQSAFDKTGRYDKKGWVDVNGIHFVKGQITADTMVHEFTEVWLEYMKRNNYEAYVQVIKMGEQDMVNNKEIVDAIKRSYGFTGVELVTEYIATVSGFNSIDKVKAFMNKNYGPETSINKSEGIMNSVKNFINKLFDAIKSLFGRLSKTPDSKLMNIDFANATFGEVLNAISDDAINGVSVFSEDEGFELKDLMENDEVHFSNVLNPISNLNDFDNAFSRDPLNMDSYTGSSKAEFYYTKLRENKKTGGLFIYYNGKNYQFNNGTKESLIKQIESKLLPDVEAGINTNLDTLDVIFKEMRNREDFIIEAEKLATAENSKLNYASLKKIYDHSGFAYGFEKVVRFSDLKYSNDPQLKMLYEEYTFGKTDPYVIIHGKDASGKLSISLLDLSADNMVGRNVNIKDRNILAAFGVDDRTFMGNGGTFENNVIGIKAFKLALLTAHIAKTNPNIKINNISIFGYPGSIMKYNTISNVESVVKNLTLVGENEKVMGMITNEYLKTLLTDKELHDSINVGTYMDILAQYLGDTTELGDMTNKSTAFIKNNKLNDVPRHELITAIKKRMKHIERVKKEHVERVSDKEYELLGSTLIELELRVNRQDLENYSGGDMNRIERLITTYQNQKNPIAQTVITAYRKAKMALVENAKKNFKSLNVFRDAYYKKYSRSNPAAFTASKIFEASSEIYKQMYQAVEVYRTVNGERKLVKTHIPFLLHYDVNNENTKRALASGEIDMTVVEYGAAIMKQLEEEMITSIMFNSEAEGNPISRTRAETLYKNLLRTHDTSKMFGSFVMPVIKKSQAEFMFKGINKFMKDNKAAREDIKSAISRSFEESGNEYSMFMDVTQEDDANVIESQFTKQIGNFDAVMSLCGMKINVDGTLEIVDEKAFDSISTNVEMASGSFMLATNRKRVYETMFVPIYNTAKVMLIKKGLNDPKKELTNTIKWLDEMFQTLVKRESPDMEGSEKWKNLVKVVKKTMRVYSNLMVGFSTKVGVKSFTIMGLTKVVDSVAYKLANLGVPEENKDQFLKLFDPKNMAQAEKFVITNFHFAWTLARKLQVIDSQEFDLLHNPVYFKTSQNLASDNIAHILNSGGDNLVRVSLAISHLISNGSLDAYSYDPATGEISYDETKDRKYYDKDGKLINAGLREVTYQDNVDIGTQDPTNQKLMLGENYRDMDMIKVNTDRFVIGSLSEDARFQLNNMIAGRLVSQFRLFSDEKLFRAGVFASTRKSMIGTGYKFVEDQYGNKVPYVEIKELEGLMQSLGAAFREVLIARNMGVKEFWQTASPERRMNLSRAAVRLIIGGMIFAMLKAALPDEDEETYQVGLTRMKYFNFLYRDMFDLMVLSETVNQPIPLVNMVTDMYGVLLNDKEFSTLWKYVPAVKGTIQNTPEMIDMLTQPLEEMDAEYDEEQRIKREEK